MGLGPHFLEDRTFEAETMSSADSKTSEAGIAAEGGIELKNPANVPNAPNLQATNANNVLSHENNALLGDNIGSRKTSFHLNIDENSIVNNHGFWAGLIRRTLAVSGPILGLMNSLTMVQTVGKLMANTTRVFTGRNDENYWDNGIYKQGLCLKLECDGNSNGNSGPNTCSFPSQDQDGNVALYTGLRKCCEAETLSFTEQCGDFAQDDTYRIFLGLWCCLWCFIIFCILFFLRKYQTDDLRYYIALEKLKFHWLTKINCVLVVLLSIGGMVFVIIKINDSNAALDTMASQRLAVIVSTLLNIKSIVPLIKTLYPNLKESSMHEQFPDAIHINHGIDPSMVNLWGLLLTNEVVFRHIDDAVLALAETGDESDLMAIGNPRELRRALALLSIGLPAKSKVDADEDVAKATGGKDNVIVSTI